MLRQESIVLPIKQYAPIALLPLIPKHIIWVPLCLMGPTMAAPGCFSMLLLFLLFVLLCPILTLSLLLDNRECKVGYVKGGGQTCKACDPGKYKSVATALESPTATVCNTCTVCKPVGQEFQSSDCNTTRDRVCLQCGIKCSPGLCIAYTMHLQWHILSLILRI